MNGRTSSRRRRNSAAAHTRRERGARAVEQGYVAEAEYRLFGGPLHGAVVEGPPADTADGVPDTIRPEGEAGAYVHRTGDEFEWHEDWPC